MSAQPNSIDQILKTVDPKVRQLADACRPGELTAAFAIVRLKHEQPADHKDDTLPSFVNRIGHNHTYISRAGKILLNRGFMVYPPTGPRTVAAAVLTSAGVELALLKPEVQTALVEKRRLQAHASTHAFHQERPGEHK
jgi:hypothetical protein